MGGWVGGGGGGEGCTRALVYRVLKRGAHTHTHTHNKTYTQVGKHDPKIVAASGLIRRGAAPSPRRETVEEEAARIYRRDVERRQSVTPKGNIQNLVVMIRWAGHQGRPLPSKSDIETIFNNNGRMSRVPLPNLPPSPPPLPYSSSRKENFLTRSPLSLVTRTQYARPKRRHTYTHTHMHLHLSSAPLHLNTCTHAHTRARTHQTRTHTQAYIHRIHTDTHTRTDTDTDTYTHKHTRTHNTNAPAHTHTHTHTHSAVSYTHLTLPTIA